MRQNFWCFLNVFFGAALCFFILQCFSEGSCSTEVSGPDFFELKFLTAPLMRSRYREHGWCRERVCGSGLGGGEDLSGGEASSLDSVRRLCKDADNHVVVNA